MLQSEEPAIDQALAAACKLFVYAMSKSNSEVYFSVLVTQKACACVQWLGKAGTFRHSPGHHLQHVDHRAHQL